MKLDLMRVTFSKDFPDLGEQIKEVRQKINRPLTQLAADAGISVPHWHRVENEKVQDLPLETLRRIEKALGVDFGVKV